MTDRDPACGAYHYRQARFTVQRFGRGHFRYHVPEITLPWLEGTWVALLHPAGWFGRTPRAVIRRVKRSVDEEFKLRELNGQSTERGCEAVDPNEALPPLPEREVA